LSDAILGFVCANPQGVKGAEVVAHLRKTTEFSEAISRNNSGAYNVLNRLLARGEIRKEGRLYLPTSNDLEFLMSNVSSNENGEPCGSPETALEGVSTTSPEPNASR
jgi:hypothetical protein